jgi:hypothetical protein
MPTKLTILSLIVLLVGLSGAARADSDGTSGWTVISDMPEDSGGLLQLTSEVAVLNPIESVSINNNSTWQDNRHRAYYSEGSLNVNGFLLFDVSAIPDNSVILTMSLLCSLENDFGSPNSNPVVDIYYSGDDGWTRESATPGSLSLDVLLVDDIPFDTYVPTYEFFLDTGAHDWSGDLADDQICLGFTNDVTYYSYVYFYGAGGVPSGPSPVLTITYDTPVTGTEKSWSGVKGLFE